MGGISAAAMKKLLLSSGLGFLELLVNVWVLSQLLGGHLLLELEKLELVGLLMWLLLLLLLFLLCQMMVDRADGLLCQDVTG